MYDTKLDCNISKQVYSLSFGQLFELRFYKFLYQQLTEDNFWISLIKKLEDRSWVQEL